MKKNLLIFFVLLISQFVLCQTPIQSFKSILLPNLQDLTQSQIDTFICKAPFENFRLRDLRDTLSFDNGFEIILFSANEMERSGFINNAALYQEAFPAHYKLPIFHLTPKGWIMATYPPANASKFKGGK